MDPMSKNFRHPPKEWLHTVPEVGVVLFAEKKIQVQTHHQRASSWLEGVGAGLTLHPLPSVLLLEDPKVEWGLQCRWPPVQRGPAPHCMLPSSSPKEHVITCSNPFRVSGASAWFLGSRRGTLGWEIRQPPRYYKQLLLITRPASSPLSAHNLPRNPGADNDDVRGNFQFQALLGRLVPSVIWNLRGTDFFQAFGAPRPFLRWPGGWGGKETGVE